RAAAAKKMKIATAESCTGGLISGALTAVAGASDVFDRGFVVYSYAAKTDMLGVPRKAIIDRGAVSPEVAHAMAEGALENSDADIAVAVTGIAGPGGGTPEKPVGLVWLGCAMKGKIYTVKNNFSGDRSDVRLQTVETALDILKKEIEGA
ncbi:MAG: CinA family protein, partial [Alphaproteobacteria bacterium]|nr:CinA family protein [Alphaproteobacteria bacterium]